MRSVDGLAVGRARLVGRMRRRSRLWVWSRRVGTRAVEPVFACVVCVGAILGLSPRSLSWILGAGLVLLGAL